MKKISMIVLSFGFFMPIVAAQAVDPAVFYNKGQIMVKGNNNAFTSIYIGGNFKAEGDALGSSQICVENTRIVLTGHFFNNVSKGLSRGTVFVPAPIARQGVFEFRGNAAQRITTTQASYEKMPSKKDNWIDFPNLDINNKSHVSLDARLAAKTRNIELTKGWLILDSQLADQTKDGHQANPSSETVLAHLLVDGTINYNKANWKNLADVNERGFIEVRLKLAKQETPIKSIVGFGSPFQGMRTDYFMFNTLLEPQDGYTNGQGFLARNPLIDPQETLKVGRGYVVGVDLRGDDKSQYDLMEGYETIDFDQRPTDGYHFNRHRFSADPNREKNQIFGNDPSVLAYQHETLNTEDVSLDLKAGYNYLSNPFTTPLSIDELIAEDNTTSSGGTYTEGQNAPSWGNNIKAGKLANRPPLLNQVWVLAPDSKAEPIEGNVKRSKYTYNYQVAMKPGGTYYNGENEHDVTALAPLQMFLVRAYSTINNADRHFKIPKSQRVMGTTHFLRSAIQKNPRRDDFILEFRDISTGTTDRVSYVLRTSQELADSKYTNVERLESTSSESNNGRRSAVVLATDFEQSLASQVYTKDASSKPLTVQFLPLETTAKLDLYHIPSTKPQPLHIVGLRINTKERVDYMWLEDKIYNNMIEITPDMLYETYSNPSDRYDRFVIHFKLSTAIEEIEERQSSVYAYQQQGNIVIAGLSDKEIGSSLELIDINGRILSQRIISQTQEVFIGDFTTGVYLLRIRGERNKQLKVVVK